jgi:hypothetical protein
MVEVVVAAPEAAPQQRDVGWCSLRPWYNTIVGARAVDLCEAASPGAYDASAKAVVVPAFQTSSPMLAYTMIYTMCDSHTSVCHVLFLFIFCTVVSRDAYNSDYRTTTI